MWANAQRDGRPAKYRWSLFNAAKFCELGFKTPIHAPKIGVLGAK